MIKIDATNIKAGGGLTHLKNLIDYKPNNGLEIEIIGGSWLKKIKSSDNVILTILAENFTTIIHQEFFKKFGLKKYLMNGKIAFIPGGTFSSKVIPYVSMSQNMLVFESAERNRFPKSFTFLRYHLLEYLQIKSFSRSKGIIYISSYAKNYIERKYPHLKNKPSAVIYHGISEDFRCEPKKQAAMDSYSESRPFRILYVSIINFYKHQWNVIDAVRRLKLEGYNIHLDLIGPMYMPAKDRFTKSMVNADKFVTYHGVVDYENISLSYRNSDLFVFASTCENMPNILVEAMSAGLPILSSSFGPMPEILRDAGEYMDPTSVTDIYDNLKGMLDCSAKREELSRKAFHYSKEFSWKRTSIETFNFIEYVSKL